MEPLVNPHVTIDDGPSASRRSVVVGLCVAIAQTVALAVAAGITASVAMKSQTVTNLADVAVGAFLLLGVLRSNCLLYTSPSPRDGLLSRMPSSA